MTLELTIYPSPDIHLQQAQAALEAAERELAWEMSKIAVDVGGIVDPTPLLDAVSMGMSLIDGDLIGAGLSLISMVPYAGDAIGKTAKGARAAKKVNALKGRISALTAKIRTLEAANGSKTAPAARNAIRKGQKKPNNSAPCVPCQKLSTQVKAKKLTIRRQMQSTAYKTQRADAFKRYQARGGTLDQHTWGAKYDQLTLNRQIGKFSEEQFNNTFGGKSARYKVRVGEKILTRVVDNVSGSVARELKSGRVKMSEFIKLQIKKDYELIKSHQMDVEWHLMNSADPDVLKALKAAGIKIIDTY